MTNQEFSNTFDTLLNSYNTLALFGELASKREIVLDEYEKSVLLTLALDLIIKSYFDGTLNQQRQGFDDSTRRQVDFSSLIKVATLSPKDGNPVVFDLRGIVYEMPKNDKDNTDVLFILNEKLLYQVREAREYVGEGDNSNSTFIVTNKTNKPIRFRVTVKNATTANTASFTHTANYDLVHISLNKETQTDWIPEVAMGSYESQIAPYIDLTFEGPSDFVQPTGTWTTLTIVDVIIPACSIKDLVVIPINYKEYDREMSKPYALPLKKQAWRLFLNLATGFDVNSELIPKFNMANSPNQYTYKIRYVKRPRPIVLEELPNDLDIDGETSELTCELNPILHMDILNKAVELAIATRGGVPTATRLQRQQQLEQ